ncbi:polysaccharide biosynthesis C-terminal domain-containing protein [Streptomyces sp. ISL-96]|uniref:lipopolysaccharide biosynthesis protein n=1 Tax=Streptomyces sp. ISL-96 TaxID=2819191 RepID=UPI001BE81F28|nr:polysaccharide biosynthesis C-terminal domain-containing protein [Streptomyces sp. ISL-96]MBT2490327.1 polysaccharide biosynthesis C-terminal domain-containing protein [Streptomyces sp. ISL-96]
MSDTTTSAQAGSPATARRPSSGRRLRLPGKGGGNPLFRNAYALMLNTGISALLGLSFWLAAARYYSESAVGQGSAAIAAMKLLAGLTALTLTGALARFIPVAGRRTGRLVLRTYAGSSVVVAVAALVFLSTLDLWGPSYSFLRGPVNGLGFVLAVVAWSLLTLQDGVLTGLRSALWVPVGNTVFSAVKLVLLIVIAASIPTAGVFVSWVAAIAVSVIPLGWLVFRRLVPRHVMATEDRAPPTLRQMGRFLAGDYTGSLFSLAVVYAVPVIVASQVSSEDNAYFYITTTIGGTVNLLAINMGASLTVEGAHDPSTLAQNCRAALRRMARIMVPVAAVLFFGAPYILGVFGEGYADAAAPLLRWFAVGALLRVVIEVYFAVLRAQSRTSPLAWLQGGLCVLVLGLTLLLLPRMGLVGAGIAEISSLAVVASVAGAMLFRVVRPAPPARSKGAEAAAPDGDLADLAVDGDRGDSAYSAGSLSEERPPGGEFGTRWALRSALDAPTMPLGARLDFDHPERRPDVRRGPETPAAGTPAAGSGGAGGGDDHRPTWALKSPVPRMIPAPRSISSVPAPASSPAEASVANEALPQRNDAPPAPRRTPLRLRVPELGVGLLLLAALALYWLPVRGIGEAGLERIGGLGLISVLPATTLLGAGLLALSFASLLWLDRPRTVLLTVALVATVVSLHALPAVLEGEPRFPTAWQHLGFMDYIDRTGTAVPDLDARWSWPGFFALATFVAEACGVEDMSSVIRWWPMVMQLLYLPPLFLLVRSMRASWRAKWAGAWIFVLSGWVGQDYFSPQGFTYGMYIAFVAVLLVWFREPRVLWTKRRPGEAEVRPAGRREKAVLLLVLVGLFAATVPAHQLTPFVMLGVLAVLVMTGRSTLRGLPMLFAVLVAVWIGFFAEPYWSGHFDELFGGLGGVGGNVTSSVSGRIEGGSSTHKLVLYVRVAMAGGVMAFACWGWWRRRFAGYSERSLLVLAFVPFLGFGMQSYGGEMALRVFMFALPGAALLAGLALFPRTGVTVAEREADRKSLAPLAALLTGLILMGGFLVSRWGNESFERTRSGEVAAMEFVYAHDDPSVRLLWMSNDTVDNVTPAIPWGARDMEKVTYVPTLAPVDPVLVAGLVKSLKDAGPNSYLMINRSQSTYLRLDAGYSPTWEKRLTANLDKRPELKKVLSNADVSMYALREQPDGPVAKPDPGPAGPKITWTPWSVVGALAALALIVLLAAREVVRVAVAPGVRQLQWLQSTFWFSLPLLAVLLASLVQRFLTMS